MKARALSLFAGLLIVVCLLCGCSKSHSKEYWIQYFDTSEVSVQKVENFSLSDSKNFYSTLKQDKPGLLIFWSPECPHCENLFAYMFNSDKWNVVNEYTFTVVEDAQPEELTDYLRHIDIFLDTENEVFDKLGLEYYPTLLIVDSDGSIVASAQGGNNCIELFKLYEQLFKE